MWFSKKEEESLSEEELAEMKAEVDSAQRRSELRKTEGWKQIEEEWMARLSTGFADVLSQAARRDKEATYAEALKLVNYANDVLDYVAAEADLSNVVANWRRRIEAKAEANRGHRGRTHAILGGNAV